VDVDARSAAAKRLRQAPFVQPPTCLRQTEKYRSRQALISFLGIVGSDCQFEGQINLLFRLRFHASGLTMPAWQDTVTEGYVALSQVNFMPKTRHGVCYWLPSGILARSQSVPQSVLLSQFNDQLVKSR
jgi:hypothetical protein